jgi:hypothetical protein
MIQPTVRYKTYLLEALVEALQAPFASHPDPLLQSVKVTGEYPSTREQLPSIVVKFYEQRVPNAGIGHRELIRKADNNLQYMAHRIYKGQAQFMVYALSSLDRAIIMDALIQIITMAAFENYSNTFLARIYSPPEQYDPAASEHWITLNTDDPVPIGGNEGPAPWQPEDLPMLYMDGYRVGILGEFYSRETDKNLGIVDEITLYPFLPWEPAPEGDPTWDTDWSPTGPSVDPIGGSAYDPATPFVEDPNSTQHP